MRILTILSVILLVSCGYDPRKTDSHDVTTHCENCKPLPYETYEPEPMPQYPMPQPQQPCNREHINADSDNANRNSNVNHNYNSIDCRNCDCEETNQNEPEEPEEPEETEQPQGRECPESRHHEKTQTCKCRA